MDAAFFLSPPRSWKKFEREGVYTINEYPAVVGQSGYDFNLTKTHSNHFNVVPIDKSDNDPVKANQMLHKVSAFKDNDPSTPSLSIVGPSIDPDTIDIKIVKFSEDPPVFDIYYNRYHQLPHHGQGAGGVRISNKRSNHTLRRRIYHNKRISLNRNRRSGRRSGRRGRGRGRCSRKN